MSITLSSATYFVGLALIVVAVLGGGVEAKEVKIPQLSTLPRILSFICGCLLLALGFLQNSGFKLDDGKVAANLSSSVGKMSRVRTTDGAQFSWFVQLGAFPIGGGSTSRAKAETIASDVQGCGDYDSLVVASADYENLVPGYLVLLLGPFDTSGEAQAVRAQIVACAADAFVRLARRRGAM